jgi:hypothetical protein
LPWHAPTFRNTLKQNDYGFTLSGPIPFFDRRIDSKKLFFMSNFEGDHTRQTAPYTASVPTTAMRGGDLSSLGVNIYDPATRVYTSSTTGTATQYPGNIIPTNAGSGFTPISQQALAILSYLPKPNVCDTSLSCGVGYNYQNGVATPIDSSNFTQRVDFSQSENVSWFARYSWENDNEITATDPFVFDSLKVPTTTNQAVLANTWVISPTAVNEVRLGWSEFLNDKTDYFANKTNVQATLGISGLAAPSPVGWGLPGLTLGGGITNFGNSGAWHLADELYHASDSFSLVRGRHTFKFGGEFGRDRFNEEGNQTSSGGFTFDGVSTSNPGITGTGSILADLLVGHPSTSVRVVSYSDIQLRRPDYAVFAQDNWKATSKITVNGGLRYENYRPWVDKHDNLINPQLFTTGVTTGPWPGLGQTPVSTLNTSIKQPILTRPGSGDFYDGLGFRYATGQNVQRGNQYLGRALVNASDLNFGPRVGVSYSPNQKLALRAGYGIYFAHGYRISMVRYGT